jgi:hypothetical protein
MQLAWQKYLAALHAIDNPAAGRPVRLEDGRLKRHRAWKYLFVRSRKVP